MSNPAGRTETRPTTGRSGRGSRRTGNPVLANNPVASPSPIHPTQLRHHRPACLPGYRRHPRPGSLSTKTPLGPLSITAHGSYVIDWGDGTSPTWNGPYQQEGLPYPNGIVIHTYDNVGTVTVTVQEVWTATWRLGAATGD